MDDLDAVLQKIEERLGDGIIQSLGTAAAIPVEVIPSGCLALDYALGTGGLPRGRLTVYFGPPKGGKSTLSYELLGQAVKMGGTAAYIDAERRGSPEYIRQCVSQSGIDPDDILISQPETGDACLEIVASLIGHVDALVLDSVAAVTPSAEIDSDIGDRHIGLHARLIKAGLKKIRPRLRQSKTALLFINQVTSRISNFGAGEDMPGGWALKHEASILVRVSRGARIRKDGKVIGIKCKAKVRENVVGMPDQTAEFEILWGIGVNPFKDIFETAKELGILDVRGGYTYYDYNHDTDEGLRWNGQEVVKRYLEAHPDLAEEIRGKILLAIRGEPADE